jgi:hypothetical protein
VNDVLWAILKSKKHTATGSAYALGPALLMWRFWMIHFILKKEKGDIYPLLRGYEKYLPQMRSIFLYDLGQIKKVIRRAEVCLVLSNILWRIHCPNIEGKNNFFPPRKSPLTNIGSLAFPTAPKRK